MAKPINIAGLDQQSRNTLDDAISESNRFWKTEGEEKEIFIDAGPPPSLKLRYNGEVYDIHLQVEGLLLQIAGLLKRRDALAFCCTIRFDDRSEEVKDPTVSGDAKNALFVEIDGSRRDIESMCQLLVHEITHKQQEIDAFLGKLGFAIGYLVTLGGPYEKEADDKEKRAGESVRRHRSTSP